MLLVEDEERMQLVRDIFNYVANGLSLGKTAEKLNMLGYRTARNKPFYEQSIRTIINDSIYNRCQILERHETETSRKIRIR